MTKVKDSKLEGNNYIHQGTCPVHGIQLYDRDKIKRQNLGICKMQTMRSFYNDLPV